MANLAFLVSAMKALSKKHSLTKHFVAQLELDIEVGGIKLPGVSNSKTSNKDSPRQYSTNIPNTPMNGILAERDGAAMTVHEMQSFVQDMNAVQTKPPHQSFGGIIPTPSGTSPPCQNKGKTPVSNTFSRSPFDSNHPVYQASNDARAIPPIPQMTQRPNQFQDVSPLANADSMQTSGNTPSSNSSTSNTQQFPYRPFEPDNLNKDLGHSRIPWPPEGGSFFLQDSAWTWTQEALSEFENQQIANDPNTYLEESVWKDDAGHI